MVLLALDFLLSNFMVCLGILVRWRFASSFLLCTNGPQLP